MLKLKEQPVDDATWLMAATVDRLGVLLWQNTGCRGTKPQSVIESITAQKAKKTSAPTFKTAEAFLQYRQQFIKD